MQHDKLIEQSSLPVLLKAVYENDVLVHESDSELEKDIIRFTEVKELEKYIASELLSRRKSALMAIYYPEAKGYIHKRRIKLNPKKCDGATFRFALEGWGIIHLQLFLKDGQKVSCRIAVNTKKRATAWADTYPENGSPALWDWKVVEQHARRLIRVLKTKCA